MHRRKLAARPLNAPTLLHAVGVHSCMQPRLIALGASPLLYIVRLDVSGCLIGYAVHVAGLEGLHVVSHMHALCMHCTVAP